jgi:hypothetical protein
MYFDYLSDNPSDPRVFLINCKVSKKYLEVQMGYLRQMIGEKPLILKDKRAIPICELDAPSTIKFLTRNLIITEKDYLKIEIKENYVSNQYFIHES